MKSKYNTSVILTGIAILATVLFGGCTGSETDRIDADGDSALIDGDEGPADGDTPDGDTRIDGDAPTDGDKAVDGDEPGDGDTEAIDGDMAVDGDMDAEDALDCIRPYRLGTVGMIMNSGRAQPGYTLFAPNTYTRVYLVDLCGELVHSWDCGYRPGHAVYLLEDGRLLHTGNPGPNSNPVFSGGGEGGIIQLFSFEGDLEWSFELSNSEYRLHHDVEMLPNGNILAIAWEYKSTEEAKAAGRNPSYVQNGLWPDAVFEIDPSKAAGEEIVWEWHIWDHLIQDYDQARDNYGTVADHPELLDLNFVINAGNPRGLADWNHTNAVDYNADLGQIALSLHNMGEIIIIEHSESSAIAAGHTGGQYGKGGDILYRWGNPRVYRAADAGDQRFFGQHDVNWIAEGYPGAGNLLVYNNGQGRPEGDYSTVDEIVPPIKADGTYELEAGEAYGPGAQVWIYQADPATDFFSQAISGARRLENGDTLICEGNSGRFFEVTDEGEMVWEYVNPVISNGPMQQGESIPSDQGGQKNSVFRAYRYGKDYPGLEGRDLEPQGVIELPAD